LAVQASRIGRPKDEALPGVSELENLHQTGRLHRVATEKGASSNMHKISVVALVLLMPFSAIGVSAQGKNAMIRATVVDQGKAVLSGASVTLTNVDTKVVQKCVSNEEGECKFEVPGGAYQLTTELSKFCPLEISGIRLEESETVPVELKLKPVTWIDPGPEYENLLKARGIISN